MKEKDDILLFLHSSIWKILALLVTSICFLFFHYVFNKISMLEPITPILNYAKNALFILVLVITFLDFLALLLRRLSKKLLGSDIAITVDLASSVVTASSRLFAQLDHSNKYSKTDAAVSLTYLEFMKSRYGKARLILLIAFFASVYLSYAHNMNSFNLLAFVPLVYFLILYLKEKILTLRIRYGVFGTNPSEAKELIRFIIDNSDSIDFTDNAGGPKQALLPEHCDAAKPHTVPRGAIA